MSFQQYIFVRGERERERERDRQRERGESRDTALLESKNKEKKYTFPCLLRQKRKSLSSSPHQNVILTLLLLTRLSFKNQ